MKRLLIISPEYKQVYGGVAAYVRKLASELSKHIKIDVLTTADTEENFSKLNENLFIYKNIKKWNIFGFIKTINFINKKNYDFINLQYVPHMYGWNGVSFSLFLFYIWIWFRKKNIFTYCHEVALPFSFKYWYWFPFAVFNRMIYIVIAIFSKKVGLSTKAWKVKSEKVFFWIKEKFIFIPAFSNIGIIKLSEAEKQNLKSKFNINEGETTLFFMGGLHPTKLIDYVLATLDYLFKKGYKVKLICAGYETEGVFDFLKTEQHYLKDKIITTGLVSEKALAQLLNISDIYLCPYRDGISTRRTSAMIGLQFGLPIVSTYGKSTDMGFFAGKKNVLMLADNKEEFMKETEWLLNDKNKREESAKHAQELYEKNFNINIVVDFYLDRFLIT